MWEYSEHGREIFKKLYFCKSLPWQLRTIAALSAPNRTEHDTLGSIHAPAATNRRREMFMIEKSSQTHLAEGLEGRLVAQRVFAGLHNQTQTGVEGLDALRRLLGRHCAQNLCERPGRNGNWQKQVSGTTSTWDRKRNRQGVHSVGRIDMGCVSSVRGHTRAEHAISAAPQASSARCLPIISRFSPSTSL